MNDVASREAHSAHTRGARRIRSDYPDTCGDTAMAFGETFARQRESSDYCFKCLDFYILVLQPLTNTQTIVHLSYLKLKQSR